MVSINEDPLWAGVHQDFRLLPRFAQGMAVIRVPGHRARADHKALFVGRYQLHLCDASVVYACRTLRDAVHLGRVQHVKLALVLQLLAQQSIHKDNLRSDPLPEAVFRHPTSLTFDVMHCSASIAVELPQRLAHPLELAGMSIARDLTRSHMWKPVIALA